MERAEDLGRAGRLTRGGPLVSGERVHRHDLDVVAERFRPRGEPVGERPPRGRIRHRVAVRDGAGQVVRPPSPAPPALVAAHTHQQMRRSLPDRHVHQPARPRRPDTRHAIAGTTRPGRRVGLRLAADQPHTAPVSPLHMALGHRTQPETVQPERHATVKRDTLVIRTRCLIRFSIHTTNKTTRPLPSTYTPKPEEPIKGCWWVNPPTPP